MQHRRKKILITTIAVIAIGFIVLSILVLLFPESSIDRSFSANVQAHRYPALDVLMKAVSYPGYTEYAGVMAAVIAGVFLIFKYRKEALFVVLTLASGIVSSAVKLLVNRPRPSQDIVSVLEKTRQQSFPSGHTQFYVVFFGFMVVLMYTLKTLPAWLRLSISSVSLLMIFIVPFSRVYLGAHWFTDVLGGFMLGLICLSVLSYWYLRKQGEKI
ncbi:phosphatase PAP2 family protein [Mucilaginibacter limnophilus]|uniref:Phosphatase PAP2 family protein n=1 Tax=Mucilaginibacter limnophilus TaxID=1932778 RepID=A0A437MUF6_9SPHI|nr:phosphatase PAP2 family protein [Mucilaginibacter limnophilus]RVU01236.1 phosphatase PAP2 family protein [Mucilaginibacter limnophilus]